MIVLDVDVLDLLEKDPPSINYVLFCCFCLFLLTIKAQSLWRKKEVNKVKAKKEIYID